MLALKKQLMINKKLLGLSSIQNQQFCHHKIGLIGGNYHDLWSMLCKKFSKDHTIFWWQLFLYSKYIYLFGKYNLFDYFAEER